MKSFLLIILSCRVLPYAFPIPKPEKITEEEIQLAETDVDSDCPQTQKTYFRSEDNDSECPQTQRTYFRSEDNVSSADEIIQKQEFSGLNGADKLDSNTSAVMKKPSCGFSNIGAFAVFPTTPKWSKTNITYRVLNYTSDMNSAEVDDTLKKVFSMWSNVSCLNFTRVPKDADIAMTFYLDGQKTPFMEEVLGYAYGPGKGAGGDVFLNEAVIWTNDNDKILAENATSLLLAVMHEVGHALGLAHSSLLGSVMYGDYTPMKYKYQKYKSTNVPYFESLMLHQDDIDGIQHLYGPCPRPVQ